jgi:hypothetical protein
VQTGGAVVGADVQVMNYTNARGWNAMYCLMIVIAAAIGWFAEIISMHIAHQRTSPSPLYSCA